MIALYFCDPMGDWVWEVREIQEVIYKATGKTIHIQYSEKYPIDEYFDILFFDWGGMSVGNSIMQSFTRQILRQAENNPNRFFVMTSQFTAEAMRDAITEFGDSKPANILLSVEEVIPYLMFKEY